MSYQPENQTLLVGGDLVQVPFAVQMGAPFNARARNLVPDRIDIHESVTADPDVFDPNDSTERILRKRGFGVHLMIGPQGDVVQHNDLLEDMPAHVGKFNRRSIGIEVVGPYYKAEPPYWTEVIRAPWAHKGRYAVPPLEQMVALAAVVDAICSAEALDVGFEFPGVVDAAEPAKVRVTMGRLPPKRQQLPGIHAHGYSGHADGWFPVLVLAIWAETGDIEASYHEAKRLAVGARGSVTWP